MPLPLWLLSGCTSIDWCERFNIDCAETVAREALVDADEDVWAAELDCDDSDPLTYPDAPELCDNKDNDCDGIDDIGEGLAEWLYVDNDADGFGDPDSAYFYCFGDEPPPGWVSRAEDCDDSSAATSPTSPERCDGEDNDCDGDIDEDVLISFYVDADGDGHGVAGETIEACSAPSGYVPLDDDCDDTDPERNPSAPEVCDRLDNDCDEDIDEDRCSAVLAEEGLILSGLSAGDQVGSDTAAAGDLNNDGYDDILIGAPYASAGSGTAYVVYGPVTADRALTSADLILVGAAEGDGLGRGLTSIGDPDSDGYSGILLGAYGADNNQGRIYLLSGPLSAGTDLSSAAAQITGEAPADNFGRAMDGAGDLSGDGVVDFIVGARGHDLAADDAGAVYVFSGLTSGSITAAEADGRLDGTAAEDFAGWSVCGAGDVNSDGFQDLAVGSYSTGDTAGAVWLVHGPVTGSLSLSDAVASLSGAPDSYLGHAIDGPGDIDGDSYSDLIVGAPFYSGAGMTSTGAVWVLHGPLSGTMTLLDQSHALLGLSDYDYAGYAVSSVGDRDGDGLPEVLIGSSGSSVLSPRGGLAYLVHSGGGLALGGARPLSIADRAFYGDDDYEYAGQSVSGAGDITGDGRADLLVGAPGRGGTGAVYLLD